MRKKMNFQRTEYMKDGELVCFGISEHVLREYFPTFSERAKKEIGLVRNMWLNMDPEKALPRPSHNSTFNDAQFGIRNKIRFFLALAIARELPIKNFYARSFVLYFTLTWGVFSLFGKGEMHGNLPKYYYNHPQVFKQLLNFPDLYYWVTSRTVPSLYIRENTHINWRTWQTPVFHQVHRSVYRYRTRKPRYLPWDGTMSQPAMPYVHDTFNGVHNGTWKYHTNTTPRLH